jgi:hypothetical protein
MMPNAGELADVDFVMPVYSEGPNSWRDRSAGKSRFKLHSWLPHYLHWYFYTLTHRTKRRGAA